MTANTIAEVKAKLDRFETQLRAYDGPLVDRVADAVAKADPVALQGPPAPDFTADEWLDVLETTAGDLYAYAHEPAYRGLSEAEHTWDCRHDGEGFIYGTKRTGELYRGDRDENAARQIRAVIEGHDLYPKTMDEYPIEQIDADEFWEVPGDR